MVGDTCSKFVRQRSELTSASTYHGLFFNTTIIFIVAITLSPHNLDRECPETMCTQAMRQKMSHPNPCRRSLGVHGVLSTSLLPSLRQIGFRRDYPILSHPIISIFATSGTAGDSFNIDPGHNSHVTTRSLHVKNDQIADCGYMDN